MRFLLCLLPVVLTACASTGSGNGNIAIETSSRGQALPGASCVVTAGGNRWTLTTPASAPVGSARGDLRVICNKNGYRTSEVVYQPSSPTNSNIGIGLGGGGSHLGVGLGFGIPISLGGGNYPSRITVEMNPL